MEIVNTTIMKKLKKPKKKRKDETKIILNFVLI
jgi:hypothetical protein